MTTVLRHLFRVQQTLLAVNSTYIRSASMDDSFRTEPRFQLQGSYRNMNKITEKIVPAMNEDELERLIVDHYVGEAQTLTTGAEANLLKFAELRGTLTPEQAERWAAIKKEFARQRLMGGAEDDPVARVTGVLATLGDQIGGIQQALAADRASTDLQRLAEELAAVRTTLQQGSQGSSEVGERLEKVGNWLGHIHRTLGSRKELDAQVGQIASHLAGMQHTAEQSTAALRQLRMLDWLVPRLDQVSSSADVARVRRAVLAEAVGALDGDAAAPTPVAPGDTALAAALPVIHALVLRVSALVRDRLPEAEQEVFMDHLRRQVAGAVTALADD